MSDAAPRIILLDLNYTLVADSPAKGRGPRRPYSQKITEETYRQWLVELCRPHTTLLVTVRTVDHQEQTLAHIQALTGWTPDGWYFNHLSLSPPRWKGWALRNRIFPVYGRDAAFYAIESNPHTTAMYARAGIPAVKVQPADDRSPWTELPPSPALPADAELPSC